MAHFKHNRIISDLRSLIKLLRKYHFDTKMELYRLDNILGNLKADHKYISDDVVFYITTSGMNVRPKVKKISVIVNTRYTLVEEMANNVDIFIDYSLQILLKGYKDEDSSPDKFSNFFCWHLDKEVSTDGNYSHPYYHFHAGGNHLKDKEIGDLLMISSPRIPHPPMDIFLAIHFIINNFYYSSDFIDQKKILTDDDYRLIIERAQKRVLDPYFSTFHDNNHTNFTRHNLFPLYYL